MQAKITRRRIIAGLTGSIAYSAIRTPRVFAFSKAQKTNDEASLAKLREGLKGEIILPGDTAYDLARRVASFNPISDRHPKIIVRCAESGDVARAISFARDNALDVAIRSGGHDLLGASVCDGLVIDLSLMKKVAVDQATRTAKISAACRAGEVNIAAQKFGLAPVLGCHPGVGVAGLTLGGGLGWLLGKHGAACDNLLGADLVMADGKVMRASATENADLFWAIRGGGGNFGVITALDLQLHPVGEALGGVLAYRSNVGGFLRFFRDFMKTAPDELTVELTVFLTEQPTIVALVCWSGDLTEGRRILDPLRKFGPPIADNIDPIAYSHLTDRFAIIGSLLAPAPRPATPAGLPQATSSQQNPRPQTGPGYNYWRGSSLRELSDSAIEQLIAAIKSAPPGASIGLGHYMHGQICRVQPQSTPLVRMPSQATFFFNTSWFAPQMANAAMGWVNRSLLEMKPFSTKGAYINYLSADDDASVRASYADNYARLAELKRKYDPTNFFHNNRNIRPA